VYVYVLYRMNISRGTKARHNIQFRSFLTATHNNETL